MNLLRQEANRGKGRDWADDQEQVTSIFGKAEGDGGYAGAVAVTDARILAFPVRSARGVFAWVTCPSVLNRAISDGSMAGIKSEIQGINSVSDKRATVSDATRDTLCFEGNDSRKLLLEDLLLEADTSTPELVHKVTELIGKSGAPNIKSRLAIVSDDAFTYFVKRCTEIATRIALEAEPKRGFRLASVA